MIMIVISFALVKFYAFAILYVLTVMQIKLVVLVVVVNRINLCCKKKVSVVDSNIRSLIIVYFGHFAIGNNNLPVPFFSFAFRNGHVAFTFIKALVFHILNN